MTIAEELILVPKKLYLKDQPLTEQILENPQIKHKSSRLSIVNRVRPKDYDGDIKKIDERLSQEDPKTESNTKG